MNAQDVNTNINVDVQRYCKTWYEIARFTHTFEKNLQRVTATYSIVNDHKIAVLNKGFTPDNRLKQIRGKAWIPDKNITSKLKVQFFWPFAANYWIIYLDNEYHYAIIGGPTKKYLWILADKPKIEQDVYNNLVSVAKNLGYDITKLQTVQQE
jgi:lipocalin